MDTTTAAEQIDWRGFAAGLGTGHLVAVGLALVLIVWLKWHERRFMPWPASVLLMCLRMGVLAVLLFTLAQPTRVWTINEAELGRIAIVMDLSESSELDDRHAPLEERRGWAAGLRLVQSVAGAASRLDAEPPAGGAAAAQSAGPASATEPAAANAGDPANSRQPPPPNSDPDDTARMGSTSVDPAAPAVSTVPPAGNDAEAVVDGSASDSAGAAAVRDRAAEVVGRWSRRERLQRLLFAGRTSLWSRLELLGSVQLWGFGGAAVQWRPDTLQPLLQEKDLEAAWSPLWNQSADALRRNETRLTAPLQQLFSDPSVPLRGVVLATDGQALDAGDALELARLYGERQIPIYPVLLGSPVKPRDLVIEQVDVPDTVTKGDRIQVSVGIGTTGFAGRELTVRLEPTAGSNEPAVAAHQVTIQGTGSSVIAQFAWPTDQVGRLTYRLIVDPQPGEISTTNNEREVTIKVVDDRSRVLLVDGDPRWEFRYLDGALSRDAKVEFSSVLFGSPFLGVLPDSFYSRELTPWDAQQTPWTGHQLVIVGDVALADWTADHWQRLARYVADEGGTVVVVAGQQHTLRQWQAHPAFQDLLPVSDVRPTGSLGMAAHASWTWRLSAQGERQSALQFAVDRVNNEALWRQLPAMRWCWMSQPKPGASVWAWGDPVGQEDAPLDPQRQQQPVPVLVHHYYGLGQVVWLATDSTWRWRYRVAERFHRRFWGQLARWAAANQFSAGNEFVRWAAQRDVVTVGDPVVLTARWSPVLRDQLAQLRTQVRLERVMDDEGEVPDAIAVGQPNLAPNSVALNSEQGAAGEAIDDAVNGPGARIRQGAVSTEVAMVSDPNLPMLSTAQARDLPPGDYRATLTVTGADRPIPPSTVPFQVRRPPSVERQEASSNRDLLDQIAAVSGGRVFTVADAATELPKVFQRTTVVETVPQEQSLWDRWPILLLLLSLLAAEWTLRRWHGLP
jgi:hypothetical protein